MRHWLVDYLVTNIGCNPDEVDLDQSLTIWGWGLREAVVLSGELSELLGRPVSPVEFWQHPTINALAGFLTAPESESAADASVPSDRGSVDEPIAVIGLGCRFPGEISGPDALWQFLCEGRSSIGEVPPIGGCRSMTARRRWRRRLAEHHSMGLVLERRRRLRCGVLRDLPARSGQDGPPAASAAGSGLGGVGARRNSAQARCAARRPEFSPERASASTDTWRPPIWAKSTHGRTPVAR